jgi:acetolactate synthase-1/3 small subunit
VKIAADSAARTEALQVGQHFGCKTVDLTETSMIFQCTGDTEKLDAFVRMAGKFKIIELVRTGRIVMSRGDSMT